MKETYSGSYSYIDRDLYYEDRGLRASPEEIVKSTINQRKPCLLMRFIIYSGDDLGIEELRQVDKVEPHPEGRLKVYTQLPDPKVGQNELLSADQYLIMSQRGFLSDIHLPGAEGYFYDYLNRVDLSLPHS